MDGVEQLSHCLMEHRHNVIQVVMQIKRGHAALHLAGVEIQIITASVPVVLTTVQVEYCTELTQDWSFFPVSE